MLDGAVQHLERGTGLVGGAAGVGVVAEGEVGGTGIGALAEDGNQCLQSRDVAHGAVCRGWHPSERRALNVRFGR